MLLIFFLFLEEIYDIAVIYTDINKHIILNATCYFLSLALAHAEHFYRHEHSAIHTILQCNYQSFSTIEFKSLLITKWSKKSLIDNFDLLCIIYKKYSNLTWKKIKSILIFYKKKNIFWFCKDFNLQTIAQKVCKKYISNRWFFLHFHIPLKWLAPRGRGEWWPWHVGNMLH